MGRLIKVLSIDGGGIRGIIPGVIMDEIERRTGKPISKMFDLVAGTSTGGILAVGITKPDDNGDPEYSASELIRLYEQQGKRIFPDSIWRRIPGHVLVSDEKYPSDGIEGVLKEYFGDAKLSESLTDVIVTAYDIEQRTPFFFKSNKARTDPKFNFRIRDVARATSAAPTYFEPFKLPVADPSDLSEYYALIDGGVYVNNPALSGYAEAVRQFSDPGNEFLVVSLGTGQQTRRFPYERAKDWGLAGWVRPLINIMFDGVCDAVDYQLKQICCEKPDGPRYYRFDIELTDVNDDFDDASPGNLRMIKQAGMELARATSNDLDRLCEQISATVPTPTAVEMKPKTTAGHDARTSARAATTPRRR
ncbi:MAG: patatin-like phospholipase family protein [Phycisphaerales bacterium]|nr:patatin-like phospholipase family protein [Phycisphaerales bacterium]